MRNFFSVVLLGLHLSFSTQAEGIFCDDIFSASYEFPPISGLSTDLVQQVARMGFRHQVTLEAAHEVYDFLKQSPDTYYQVLAPLLLQRFSNILRFDGEADLSPTLALRAEKRAQAIAMQVATHQTMVSRVKSYVAERLPRLAPKPRAAPRIDLMQPSIQSGLFISDVVMAEVSTYWSQAVLFQLSEPAYEWLARSILHLPLRPMLVEYLDEATLINRIAHFLAKQPQAIDKGPSQLSFELGLYSNFFARYMQGPKREHLCPTSFQDYRDYLKLAEHFWTLRQEILGEVALPVSSLDIMPSPDQLQKVLLYLKEDKSEYSLHFGLIFSTLLAGPAQKSKFAPKHIRDRLLNSVNRQVQNYVQDALDRAGQDE